MIVKSVTKMVTGCLRISKVAKFCCTRLKEMFSKIGKIWDSVYTSFKTFPLFKEIGLAHDITISEVFKEATGDLEANDLTLVSHSQVKPSQAKSRPS